MNSDYKYEVNFKNADFSVEKLEKGDYECCTFQNCSFLGTDLRSFKFIDSVFIDCDLSNSNITQASFQDVTFKNCKLLGLKFDTASKFGFSIEFISCKLNDSSFYNMKLMRCIFSECTLHNVDFTQSEMKSVKISNADLLNAIFYNTNLEQVDFRSSINYSIDPEKNKIKNAKFSVPEVFGLLDKYQIVIE